MDPGRQNRGAEAPSAGLTQKNNNGTKDAEMDEEGRHHPALGSQSPRRKWTIYEKHLIKAEKSWRAS